MSHLLHWYGFSPVWIFTWLIRILLVENILIISIQCNIIAYHIVSFEPHKSILTMAALKFFLSSVCHHMPYKLNIIWKSVAILVALKWFLFNVISIYLHYSPLVIISVGCNKVVTFPIDSLFITTYHYLQDSIFQVLKIEEHPIVFLFWSFFCD